MNLREKLEQTLGRKAKIESGGKIIVERGDESELLVMFADGEVRRVRSRKHAEQIISAESKRVVKRRKLDGLITTIEWRL
jgi:hypothetical protein